jgi:hypothetical protein
LQEVRNSELAEPHKAKTESQEPDDHSISRVSEMLSVKVAPVNLHHNPNAVIIQYTRRKLGGPICLALVSTVCSKKRNTGCLT